jgi:hypothetical protein
MTGTRRAEPSHPPPKVARWVVDVAGRECWRPTRATFVVAAPGCLLCPGAAGHQHRTVPESRRRVVVALFQRGVGEAPRVPARIEDLDARIRAATDDQDGAVAEQRRGVTAARDAHRLGGGPHVLGRVVDLRRADRGAARALAADHRHAPIREQRRRMAVTRRGHGRARNHRDDGGLQRRVGRWQRDSGAREPREVQVAADASRRCGPLLQARDVGDAGPPGISFDRHLDLAIVDDGAPSGGAGTSEHGRARGWWPGRERPNPSSSTALAGARSVVPRGLRRLHRSIPVPSATASASPSRRGSCRAALATRP